MRQTGVEMIEMPQYHWYDYEAQYEGVQVNVEIKCRDIKWGQYPTIILSKTKFMKGYDRLVNHGERFRFVVRYKTGIQVLKMKDDILTHVNFKKGGRRDRNDPRDIEDVADIPLKLFKPFAYYKRHQYNT
jgi:hypothetical protein